MADRVARAMFGTAVGGLAFSLAANDLVTGGYPSEEQQRNTLPRGWQPWSLKVPNSEGGHTYVELSKLGPIAIPFAIGAVVGSTAREGVVDPARIVSSLGRFMLDQSFLQGMNAVTDAIKDPERYAENFSETMATSFMPYGSMQRQITRALGMADRDPKGAVEALLAISPVTVDQVPRRQDQLGRDRQSAQTGAAAFVSPLRFNSDAADPVLNLFRENKVNLPDPPKAAGGVTLTREEQARFSRLAGQEIQRRVLEMQGELASESPERRRKMLETAVERGRKAAWREMVNAMTDDEFQRRRAEAKKP